MQGFALPFALVMTAVFVTAMRILIGTPFPTALIVIGAIAAIGALGFGIFLSYLFVHNADEVDYIEAAKVKRVSIYLHIAEAILLIVWLNWITNAIALSGAISGPAFLVAATIVIALRIARRRLTRRRQLWER